MNTTKFNPMRVLSKIAIEHTEPLENVYDTYNKFTYKLYRKGNEFDKETLSAHDKYGVDLTARYYQMKNKTQVTNHDEVISKWRKEGSEIKYFRDWPSNK